MNNEQHTAITQNILAEIPATKITLKLFDQNLEVPKGAVGKISLKILVMDSVYPEEHKTKKIKEKKKKLEIDNGYNIYGEIVAKEKIEGNKFEYCILDVDKVILYLKTEKDKFRPGEHIYAHASRLDVYKAVSIGDASTKKLSKKIFSPRR